MAQLLIKRGADPNGSKGKYFPPCIVIASSMNYREAIQLLLDAGADPNLYGNDKVTALEVACEFDFDFIDLLISKGAKVTGRVISAAYKNKKYEVIDRFLNIYPVESIECAAINRNEEAEEFKRIGNEEFHNKNYEKAIELYTKAIELSPLSIYYSNRSQAFIFYNKLDEAIEDARTSRKIDPKNFKALLREGQALCLLGNYTQAAGCYWYALKGESNPGVISVFLDTLTLII